MNSDSDSFEQDDESYDEQDEESYDEEQHDQLPNVDEYKAQVGHREQKPSFWGTFCCLTILTIVVTVVAVVLAQLKEGIGRATKNAHPFIHYNSEKFLQVKEYVTTVRGISHQDNFEVDTSPTFIAAQWMAHGDEANHTVPQVADLSYDERFALAVLYFATGGHKDWHYEVNFMGKGHVCTWFNSYTKLSGEQDVFGVSGCKNDEKGRMYPSVLHLSGVGLSGFIPEEVKGMLLLETMMLDNNENLKGTFTEGLGFMQKLKQLKLHKCSINGNLPPSIGKLTDLIYLSLGSNAFTGSLPTELNQLTNLSFLAIDNNDFRETNIDIFKPNFENLVTLIADKNLLTGTISVEWLSSFTKLQELDLSENMLDGRLPDNFFNICPSLESIDLHDNRIEGNFPNDILGNDKLEYLALYDNQFQNTLPVSIAQLSSLKHLDLAQNQLKGSFPESLQFMKNLKYLFLGENAWDPSPIPSWITELTEMRDLSLKDCRLRGMIPDLERLSNLEFLDFHKNELTGSLPSYMGTLGKLKMLLLKDNLLTGSLPPTFVALTDLQVLLLEQNDFKGTAEAFCGRDSEPDQAFVSDCEDAKFQCGCCTTCCSSSDTQCNTFDWKWRANLDPSWNYGFQRQAYFYSPDFTQGSWKGAEGQSGSPLNV